MAFSVSPPVRPGGNDIDTVRAQNLQSLDLASLDGMPTMASLEVLNVSGNRLTNFYGMPTHPSLRCFEVSDNRITSLLGMSHQPALEVVTMENNPICAHPEFRLMVLLACGESVSIINHRVVSDEERRLVASLGGSGGWAARCVSFGWTDVTLGDRGEDAWQQLADDLKVNYVALVRCLDRNYSYAAVMDRRDDRDHLFQSPAAAAAGGASPSPPRHARDNGAPAGGVDAVPRRLYDAPAAASSPSYTSSADRRAGGSSSDAQRFSAYQQRPALAGSSPAPSHETSRGGGGRGGRQQLTLNDLSQLYRDSGAPRIIRPEAGSSLAGPLASAAPTGGRGPGSSVEASRRTGAGIGMPQQQDRPLGVNPGSADATMPRHYTAVDAARRYADHYKRNGTVVGANVMDVFPRPSETDAAMATARAADEHGRAALGGSSKLELPQARQSVLGTAALVLLQQEVGCLCGMDFDNVDVVIGQDGSTFIRDVLCRITGAGQLHIMERSQVVFETDLPGAKEIALDKTSAIVRVVDSRGATLEFQVRDSVGDSETREHLARGVFKMLMLFKCTPAELSTFYATTLIRGQA